MACYQWVLKSEKTERARMRDSSFRYLNKLAGISISLSAEDDLMTLLRKILEEGQNIACCDAASLFLINEVTEQSRELVFKLTQNDSMDFPFEEMRFPLDDSSIAGYVAYAWGNASNRFRHGVALCQVNLDGDGFQKSASVNST